MEHDEQWYYSCKELKTNNMELRFIASEDNYAESILAEPVDFDVVVVDGINRAACCLSALKKLKGNGMVILDNSDRASEFEDYALGIKTLKDANLIQIDFNGFGPINDYTWCTSLFLSREFDFKAKQHPLQPLKMLGNISEIK